jgi:3-methyladenine DNA glycosylase/8-oxoguanine DNA glycosylase
MAGQSHTPTRPAPDAGTAQRRRTATSSMHARALESERDNACRALARRDDALARLIARHRQPDPFHWDVLDDRVSSNAFSELALHIISQQLSTTATLAIYDRVQTLLEGKVDPQAMIAATAEDLRAAGLSGAKARSLQDLAGRIVSAQSAFVLQERPSPQWLETRAQPWRPFRSYAAALLWARDRN